MSDTEARLLETLEDSLSNNNHKKYKKKNNNIFQDLEDDEVILLYTQIKKPDFGKKIGKYLFMGMYPHKINGELLKEVECSIMKIKENYLLMKYAIYLVLCFMKM